MLSVLANRTYLRLFAAQVIALAGTGLMTVALALLAFELAGQDAGAVLGTALAIKMIVYVGVSPVVGDLAGRLPRRAFLVTLDMVRACVAVALPFVDQVWQIYLLIAMLQTASAAFTPTFQATIPDILPDEKDYTHALSLSRMAYELENLLSPTLAVLLISLIGFHWLFAGTVVGFLGSAALILSSTLPPRADAAASERATRKIGRGIGIYLATPRLRGLLAIDVAVAAAGAMVIVNTVVLVRGMLGLADAQVALAMAFFGGGSMLAVLFLPRLLEQRGDRTIMLVSAASMTALLLTFALVTSLGVTNDLWVVLLGIWLLLGAAYSAAQVPSGRLLRRSAHAADRPAVYAAQFALSHACWLVTYPLAGWMGSSAGIPATLVALGVIAGAGALLAAFLWPATDPETIAHEHPELAAGHPHLAGDGHAHSHPYVIDDLHRRWPAR